MIRWGSASLRQILLPALLSLYPLGGLAGDSIGLPPPAEPLALLVYKMEVLNYCGMIDDEISHAFRQQRDQIITNQKMSPEKVQRARSVGWQAGLAEWQNRGLGGFKNWCKTDGQQAAEYFHNRKLPRDTLPTL